MFYKITRENGTALNNIKSCVYTENCNAGTDLRPGCVASASIVVEAFGGKNDAVANGELLSYYRVDTNNTETLLGKFYAEPSIYTKSTYRFEAWDEAAKLDTNYSERLNAIQGQFPMTLSELVQDVASTAGVTLASTVFPMSTMPVQAFYAANISCRQVMSWAAEIACRFVRCNSDGELEFAWYEPVVGHNITPGAGGTNVYYKQDGLHYEYYLAQGVDRVAVRPSDVENAAYVYPSSASDVYAEDENHDGNVHLYRVTVTDDGNGNIVFTSAINARDDGSGRIEIVGEGSGGNTLIISDNPLLNNALEETYVDVAENIYNEMSDIGTYRPFECSLFPFYNPFRAGDIVTVTDSQGTTFSSPVMSMAITDSSARISASGSEKQSDVAADIVKQIVNLAENIVRIKKLKVDWAEIDTAIVDSLEANGINADWINAGHMSVGNIDFGQPQTKIRFPVIGDPESLFTGQSYSNGWITQASPSATTGNYGFTVAMGLCDDIRGKTVEVAFEYDGSSDLTLINDSIWTQYVGEEVYTGYIFTSSVADIAAGTPPTVSEDGVVSGNVSVGENGEKVYRNSMKFIVDESWDYVRLSYHSTDQIFIRNITVTVVASNEFSVGYSNNNHFGYDGLKLGLLVVDETGNITCRGNAVFDDLVVEGNISASNLPTFGYVDDASARSSITLSSGYYSVTPPSLPTGAKITNVALISYTSADGAFNVIPYGSNATYAYVIGTPGTTITGLRLRFWYEIGV